jgi:hypothetical protein
MEIINCNLVFNDPNKEKNEIIDAIENCRAEEARWSLTAKLLNEKNDIVREAFCLRIAMTYSGLCDVLLLHLKDI